MFDPMLHYVAWFSIAYGWDSGSLETTRDESSCRWNQKETPGGNEKRLYWQCQMQILMDSLNYTYGQNTSDQ